MLLDILVRCTRRLPTVDEGDILALQQRADMLVAAIVASIPYHLAQDPMAFIGAMERRDGVCPARPVGGLLLLHPLFVTVHCSLVSTPLKAYFRRCLCWIGQHMGIGQATLLSEVS